MRPVDQEMILWRRISRGVADDALSEWAQVLRREPPVGSNGRKPGGAKGSRRTSTRRICNLFSYTGALSFTCALAGAATDTSVDTSAGVQAWAAGNFARANLVDAKRWRFETGDAVRFLARAARDKERYDTVLIDPPTFSTARGTPWTLDRDYPDLIAKAAAVIPSDGILWLAANTHELGSLAKLAQKGLRAAGRTGSVVEQGGLPPEYPTLAAQPHDRYLQVCVLRLT